MKNKYRKKKRTFFRPLLLAFVLMLTNFSICSATTYGTNLVVNGNGGDGSSTTGWTNSDVTNFTSFTSPPFSSVNGGNVFDYYPGGTGSTATLVQTIDISDKTSDVSGNGVKAVLNGEVIKYLNGDIARITLEQLDAGNSVQATTNLESDGINTWQSKSITIPKLNASTVKLKITLTAYVTGTNGSEYVEFDGIELILSPLIPPTITTQAVSSIASTTATGNGNITALGSPNPAAYGVCWNTGGSPTTLDSKVDKGATSSIGAFAASITGLTANTIYKVRAYATNMAGTSYGTEVTFTTLAIAPTAASASASSISSTAATFNGTVNANNATSVVTFDYGTSTSYGSNATATQSPITGTSTTSVSSSVTGLTPNTTYHFRVKAVNTAGTTYGADETFVTAAIAPTAASVSASSISSTAATLNGTVNANNATSVVTFDYGTSTSYGSSATATQSPLTGTSATAVSYALSGLTPNTTYHFRVKAVNTAGTNYGTDETYTTTAIAPSATTVSASSISSTAATLNGTVNANNATSVVTFDYGTSTSYGSSATATQSPLTGTSATAVSYALSGLIPNTTYHFRVKAVNTAGTTYGTDETYTTTAIAPSATTVSASSISSTAATLNGTVDANNATSVVTFDYGTSTSYGSSATATQSPLTGTSATAVSYALSGLTPNTTYHFRVKAVNTAGTTYGTDETYTTTAIVPSATTVSASSISSTAATLNGTVDANNATSVVTFDYGTSTSYGSSATATQSPLTGISATAVSYALSGLTPNTTYHFRVKAVNTAGTTYGTDETYTTTAIAPSVTTVSASSISSTAATLNGTVNANNATSVVTFDYGTSTSYGSSATATQSPLTGTSATSVSYALSGITPNTTYHFRVKAVNTAGTTLGNEATFTTEDIIPNAPTIGTATAGDGQASISFTVPASNGGSAITGYTVTSSPDSKTGTGTTSPITVTGLTNGTAYTFTVTATNGVGTSAASAASNSVTPKADQTISFANPSSKDFGTSPTLVATASSGLAVTFTTSTPDVCSITSGGTLTFKKSGTCTILADQAGDAAYNAAPQVSQSFTVNAVVPDVPTMGIATVSDGQASVSFTPSVSNGGADVTYTVTSNPGNKTGTGTISPITVTGLTNGTAYTFTVTAANTAGTSAASAASNSVTPKAGQTISFANPGSKNFGTSPTLSATASSSLAVTFTTSTPDVCFITSGGTLTFKKAGTCTVLADQAGDAAYNAAAQVSQSFTVNAVVPDVPTIGTAAVSDGQASVSFTPSVSNGGADVTYTVTSTPGSKIGTGTTSPITVTGLTNGTAYTFTVTAANTAGTSAASGTSNSVTPHTLPTATTEVATDITSSGVTLNGTINANGASTAVTFEYGTTIAYGTSVAALQSPVSGVSATSVSKALTGLLSNTTYHYRVVGVNEAGTTNGPDQTFTTALNTGLDNPTTAVLSLYPNPTVDGFYINAGDEPVALSICDLSGSLLLTQQVARKNYINVSSLPKGVYLVKANGLVGKLVKK